MSTAKERHRVNILKYLGDPTNDWLTRKALAEKVCNYRDTNSIYKIFTPEELDEIEREALDARKTRSAPQRAMIYQALYQEALKGNVQAAKEFLDRTEGKVTGKVTLDANDNRVTSIEVRVVRPGDVLGSVWEEKLSAQ